jgi:hypothetical protein
VEGRGAALAGVTLPPLNRTLLGVERAAAAAAYELLQAAILR